LELHLSGGDVGMHDNQIINYKCIVENEIINGAKYSSNQKYKQLSYRIKEKSIFTKAYDDVYDRSSTLCVRRRTTKGGLQYRVSSRS